jgi:hypothetical protein
MVLVCRCVNVRISAEVYYVHVCMCALICGLEQLPGPVHFSLLCLGVCISFGMHNYLQGILSLDYIETILVSIHRSHDCAYPPAYTNHKQLQ